MRDKMVVLLNSGGLDSFMAGKWLEKDGYQIHSLHIHWLVNGSVYNPELLHAAEKTADIINAASHEVFTMEGNLLFGQGNKLPHRPCCSSTMYYAIACAYAYNIGARYVSAGHKFSDKSNSYEKEYFQAIKTLFKTHFYGKNRKLMKAGFVDKASIDSEPPIELLLPIYKKSSSYIKNFNLTAEDIKHTYSCAFYPPCGNCCKCSRSKRLGLLD